MLNAAYKTVIAGLFLLSSFHCKQSGGKDLMLENHNLGKPEKFSMPESVLEISGIAFYKGRSETVYAINDEEGRLFRLAWKEKKQYNGKFGKGGDYEDVAIVNEKVIILKSNGRLFSFPFANATEEEISDVIEYNDLLPEGEYEGMYGDEASGKLYVICKNCEEDDPKKTVSGYIFQIGEAVTQSGTFKIDVNQIKSQADKVKRGFQPAGLTKDPLTNDWFIVSGLNKLLVITDSAWKIKEAYPLNGNTFNQPEGIAFDKEGNLYISNEGDDISDGNILKFKRLTK